MEIEIIRPVRGRNNVTITPGTIKDFPEETAKKLIDVGAGKPYQTPEDPRLFSNGKPTFATIDDLPHIRLYAWCLANLRFAPILSSPTDFSRAAEECRLSIEETREAFRKLLKDGDLLCERGRQSGKEIYYLAPIRW